MEEVIQETQEPPPVTLRRDKKKRHSKPEKRVSFGGEDNNNVKLKRRWSLQHVSPAILTVPFTMQVHPFYSFVCVHNGHSL